MGFTYVDVTVKGLKKSKAVRMLADTGSTYIMLGFNTVDELGLFETPYMVDLTLADGRKTEAKLYLAEVEVLGRKGPAFIAQLRTPIPMLGVYALETLGLKVNPMTGKLEETAPEGGYLLTAKSLSSSITTLKLAI